MPSKCLRLQTFVHYPETYRTWCTSGPSHAQELVSWNKTNKSSCFCKNTHAQREYKTFAQIKWWTSTKWKHVFNWLVTQCWTPISTKKSEFQSNHLNFHGSRHTKWLKFSQVIKVSDVASQVLICGHLIVSQFQPQVSSTHWSAQFY